jgi:hypothetical protein
MSLPPLLTQVSFAPDESFSCANFLQGLPGLMAAEADVRLSDSAMLAARAIARTRFIWKRVAMGIEGG